MPVKKSYAKRKRTTKRGRAKRRYKKSKPSFGIALSRGSGTGLGPKANIVFASQNEETINTGIDAVYQYYLNSAYDPLGANGSAQPPQYDSLLAATGPFLRYRVTAAQVKTTIVNLAAVPVRAFMYVSDSALDMSLITSYILQNDNMVTSTIMTPSGGARDIVTLKRYYNFAKLWGKQVYTDDEFQAGYNASPADLFYVYIGVQSLDGATTVNFTHTYDIRQYTQLESAQTESNHTTD